jgi:hypothetical protein
MSLRTIRALISNRRVENSSLNLPFDGFSEERVETKFVENLTDDDLRELNSLLRWQCFTADSRGRRFGDAAWKGKRCEPQAIPDRRVALMHEKLNLSNKHVLEVGCFEGVHTIGLGLYAGRVTAIDSRIENVVKTIVRCAFFDHHPTVFKCNLEEVTDFEPLRADLLHHVGVLYHLKDPVKHLLDLGQYIKEGIMLDTHYCLDSEATDSYEAGGKVYRYKRYQEGGKKEVFSGMYDHAKWLRLDDIKELLSKSGFSEIRLLETRQERNGPRVLLIAKS